MSGRRLRWLVVAVLAAAIALPFLLTVEPPAPPDGWHVNVRVAPGVDEQARRELEATYRLTLIGPHAERTWIYRLGDASRSNIRALVTDPRVEDTHGIDRQAFSVAAPRVTLARRIADRYPREVAGLLDAVSLANLLVLVTGVCVIAALRRERVVAFLERGIPPLSSAGLGLYRLAFGLALIAVVIDYNSLPDAPLPRELHRAAGWFADWEWVHALASGPGIDRWTTPVSVALLAAFAVGLFARPAFIGFVGVLTVYVLVTLQHKSMHDWGLPLVTLWGLTVVPWGEGVGVDRWRRRTPPAPLDYGFAVWFPGLMIGLAFAAAAFAKLQSSGLAWITGGAVKYHFIEDFRQAPTTWGLWIAVHEPAAVAFSAAAILAEGFFILHVFFRSAWVRAAFGLVGVSVMLGFRLLQGIEWLPWWVLFLCFVPWQPLAARLTKATSPGIPAGAPAPLGGAAAAVVALVILVQTYASAHRYEAEPFVSDFGMYSWTWPSRAEFDAKVAGRYRRYTYNAADDGSPEADVTDRIRGIPNAGDVFADVVEVLRAGQPLGDERRRELDVVVRSYEKTYGKPLGRVVVLLDEQVFDWNTGRFVVKARHAPIGVLDPVDARFMPAH